MKHENNDIPRFKSTRTVLGGAVVFKVFGAGLSFLFNIMLARILGAEGAGVFFLALTVTSIASIVGRLGIDISLLRFVASAAAQGDWQRVKGLSCAGLRMVVFASIVSTLVIMVTAPWLANFVFSTPSLVVPLRVMALAIPFISLKCVYAELLKAVRRVQHALLVQGLALPLFNLMFVFGLSQIYHLIGVTIAYVASTGLVLLLSIILWLKGMPQLRGVSCSCDVGQLRAASVPLLVVALMNVVVDMTDTIMIGIFLGSVDVGMYAVALRTVSVGSLLLVAVNSVVAPEFSTLWEKGDRERLSRLVRKVTLIMAAVASVLLLIFLIFSSSILQLFGTEFRTAELTLRVLALGQFIVLATGPVAYLLMMSGHERFHRNNVIFCAIINMLLNIYLIPRYGITGAAVATALSLTAKNILAVVFVKKKLGIGVFI